MPADPTWISSAQFPRPLPLARHSKATTVLDAEFEFCSEDNFRYSPSLFDKTQRVNPAAVGYSETTKIGYRETLTVELGGSQDDALAKDMSAGWERDFFLPHASDVTVIVVFQVETGASQDEALSVQALCSVDGVLHGRNATVDYLALVDATAPSTSSEFETVTLRIPSMPKGPHTIGVGGLMHQENDGNEMAWVRFDRVVVLATSSTSRTSKKSRLRQRPY
jgi:hypothetical protein